jgi:PAS domain S-box-containing protein
LIQNSSDIITLLAADGTVLYVSPPLQRILGYRPEAVIGQNIFAYVHPDDLSKVQTHFHEVIQRPGIDDTLTEFRIRSAGGAWLWLESVSNNLLDDPYLNRFVSPDSIIPDPANPQSFNRYSYAYNNPVKYTDPSGHCIWDACIVEGAIIGAGLILAVDYAIQVNNNLNEGMSFGDAVYYQNINTQELGGATLIGAGGGGLAAWAAPAVAPYAYYAADKANTFFQTPAGRAVGNGIQGGAQACAENCTAENVIAGGLQDVIMGGVAGDYSTGTAFSGAFDPVTGNVGVRPSTYDGNRPAGWVPARGGHGIVANDMAEAYGSNRNDLYGYTITYDSPGELSILSWRSDTLNTPHGTGKEPPANIQTQIIDALKEKTGWNVTAP